MTSYPKTPSNPPFLSPIPLRVKPHKRTMAKKIAETPMMKQYMEFKAKHPDAILLFRVGDFYETFSDDAIAAAEILGITLTKRANGSAMHVELAGFPHHALDTYLPKLVRAGRRVAICDQLEDPKLTKKLVKRGITELVTPGVVLGDNVLRSKENNYLAAVWLSSDGAMGERLPAGYLDGRIRRLRGTPRASGEAPQLLPAQGGTRRAHES